MLWDCNFFFPLILLILPIYIIVYLFLVISEPCISDCTCMLILCFCTFFKQLWYSNPPAVDGKTLKYTPSKTLTNLWDTALHSSIFNSLLLFLCNFTGYHLLHIIIAIIVTFIWFLNYPIWSLSINPIHVVHDSSAFGCYTEMNGNVSGEYSISWPHFRFRDHSKTWTCCKWRLISLSLPKRGGEKISFVWLGGCTSRHGSAVIITRNARTLSVCPLK